jgi:hypothetical protein
MQAVNWLALQPTPSDLDALHERIQETLPARKVRQLLVEIVLKSQQWDDRADLIPFYHPSRTFKRGQYLALPTPDPQGLRPTVWHVARVKLAETVENLVQGTFQALTLDILGKQIQMAGGIFGAQYVLPAKAEYTPDDLTWFSAWVADAYAGFLQAVLETLVKRGQLQGQFVGDTFIPGHIPALSYTTLARFFKRLSESKPWASLDEIRDELPELANLQPATALALICSALDESPYRSLGGDRWTTQELFIRLNREVPRGLPAPRIRSKLAIWTEQDKQDLAGYRRKKLPIEAQRALDELEEGDTLPAPAEVIWQPPSGPVRLPTLNYLHITQAYFPIGHIVHAFAPDVRLAFVQFIEGEHYPYLLDRDEGLLKALHPEILRTTILDQGIPAGTYLWLEYQGGEKYRITPRPLPAECMVPCKLASIKDDELHIEHTEIPMRYEGDSSVFKANMRFEDIEALFAEARRVNLSVRDAIVYAVQELCASDPNGRAHRLDIFNTVFLKRMCSPNSVSLLLYTQPCFEQLGGGYFRYQPSLEMMVARTPKRKQPKVISFQGDFSVEEPESSLETKFQADEQVIPVSEIPPIPDVQDLPQPAESQEFIQPAVEIEPLDKTVEEVPELPPLPISLEPETEALHHQDLEPATEKPVNTSPLVEPAPASTDIPTQPARKIPAEKDAQKTPVAGKSEIPIVPLHKQTFYRRIFFYVRTWIGRIFRRTA